MSLDAGLKAALSYNPETGELTWVAGRGKSAPGRKAGSVRPDGYVRIQFNKKTYYAHRVAFFLAKGYWPKEVDHINHDRADNRLCNLREVTTQENKCNTSLSKRNTSGRIGVCPYMGSWRAYIHVHGERINLGDFADIEDAIRARETAEAKYGFHENHGARHADS